MRRFFGTLSFNLRIKLGRLVIVVRLEPAASVKARKRQERQG
jgi:hypothetical protein